MKTRVGQDPPAGPPTKVEGIFLTLTGGGGPAKPDHGIYA
jgi:hypothetical protein